MVTAGSPEGCFYQVALKFSNLEDMAANRFRKKLRKQLMRARLDSRPPSLPKPTGNGDARSPGQPSWRRR